MDIGIMSCALRLCAYLTIVCWMLGIVSADVCDPCKDCEVCLANDPAPPEAGVIRCEKCDAGFRLEGECCVPSDSGGSCVCTLEFNPVCGVDGMTYPNACQAGCSGTLVECLGECPCGKPPPGACTCLAGGPRVCGKDGNEYGNACLAGCEGVEAACDGPCPCGTPPPPPAECPPGVPKVICILDPCRLATCSAFPTAVCESNFCGDCNAIFTVNGQEVDCTEPPAPVPPPPAECPPGVPKVTCILDPCRLATCPAFPTAVCESNFCGDCNAIFTVNGQEVDCTEPPAPVPPPPAECPPGVPKVTCILDPCRLATCSAFPTAVCESNFCGDCNAIFTVNGKEVKCSRRLDPVPSPPPSPKPSPPRPRPTIRPPPRLRPVVATIEPRPSIQSRLSVRSRPSTRASCKRGVCTATDTCCSGQCCAPCGSSGGRSLCGSNCSCGALGK
ncbi:hypothetical protein BSKO_06462 [Bryopsis sp. KO-2023]|nr:hypothetical protein BSKO_06462 [Bryopsis sp. KO-2023]